MRRIYYWHCKCDCGETTVVCHSDLRFGKTVSCGCVRVKHGGKSNGKTMREYAAWNSLRDRCTNPNSQAWHNYGGRGITVCDRWNKFENFMADMGACPDGYEIDRRDVNGNYEPSNCRWVTPSVNAANRRPGVRRANGTYTCLLE